MKLEDYEYFRTPNGVLYLGDCLEIMPLLEPVDFGFADPPYGINKAEWDIKYPIGFEKELLRLSKNGIAITPGQKNIGICINAMGDHYKGILSARNLNGMTFSNMGFENWIPTILGGNIRRGQNYFEFSISGKKPIFPSPKPLSYMMILLQKFTNDGDLIIDPFGGSGTTAVAAEKLNRKWILIELEIKNAAIAKKRIERETQQLKLW